MTSSHVDAKLARTKERSHRSGERNEKKIGPTTPLQSCRTQKLSFYPLERFHQIPDNLTLKPEEEIEAAHLSNHGPKLKVCNIYICFHPARMAMTHSGLLI
jgi:hypothetical protein